jgi:Neurotransmitter-gated ion-channel ligand binding domain/Neurotransmitter-gated ion-channel transmembrane region
MIDTRVLPASLSKRLCSRTGVCDPSSMAKLICAAILLFLAAAPLTANAEPPPAPPEPQSSSIIVPPPQSSAPIPVKAGIYILNLVSLNEADQTFTCTGYLTETWNDPRLAFPLHPGEPAFRLYRKTAIWFPLLQFYNSASPRKISSYLLSGASDGTVSYTEKFSVRLSTNMHLRAFPFDSQDLQIVVHPFTNQPDGILLSPDPSTTGISPAPYTPLPLWHTGTVTYRPELSPEREAGGKSHYQVTFEIQIVRNSEYYIYRIFLPLALMVAVSWGVLWVPPNDLNSQLLISVTTVLTLVVFSVALSNTLPPVAYLTFYDIFFLVSFFFVLLTIGEPLLVHQLHNVHGKGPAHAARRISRVVLPFLFFATAFSLAAIFLR